MQTWTSSFWLTRREFFRALRPGRVLYLGERRLLVKGLGVLTNIQTAGCPSAAEEGERGPCTTSPETEMQGQGAQPCHLPGAGLHQGLSRTLLYNQCPEVLQNTTVGVYTFLVLKGPREMFI